MNHHATGLALLAAVQVSAPAAADPPGVVTFPRIDGTRSSEVVELAGDERYIALAVVRFSFDTVRKGFVVILDTQTGEQVARIDPPAPDAMEAFGIQISIDDGVLYVATQRDERFGLPDNPGGSVTAFSVPEGDLIATLTAPAATGFDYFGLPIVPTDDVLVIGAPSEGFPNAKSGAVYTFTLPDLQLIQRIGGINVEQQSVAFPMIANDDFIAWVRGTASNSLPDDAVFVVHNRDTGQFVTEAQPTADGIPVTTASFGLVADGRYAVLGDIRDDRAGVNAGWVYVFDFQQMEFVNSFGPPPGSDGRQFGIQMAMRGSFVALATPNSFNTTSGLQSRVDIVHVPSGQLVRSIDLPVNDTGDFGELFSFGQALTFVARGVAITSNSSSGGTRVDYIPIPELCPADTNADGDLTPADLNAWLDAFNTAAPACDQNYDGQCRPNDFNAWIANFNDGCG